MSVSIRGGSSASTGPYQDEGFVAKCVMLDTMSTFCSAAGAIYVCARNVAVIVFDTFVKIEAGSRDSKQYCNFRFP